MILEIMSQCASWCQIIDIDLKEKIVYANVDLGNGLSDTEVAREKLAENEEDFRKQIQRIIESF